MRFVDEYRDPALAKRLAAEIAELAEPGRRVAEAAYSDPKSMF